MFVSFYIAIKLMPRINEFIARQFGLTDFLLELTTIFVVYVSATFFIPIILALVLLWLLINFRKR